MMPIFDTHVHYNLEPLTTNWQHHWQLANTAGVTHSVVVGTDSKTSLKAVEIALTDKHLFAAIGLHPSHVDNTFLEHITELKSLLTTQASNICAIGEIGLDFYRVNKQDPSFNNIFKNQVTALELQLELALQNNLPIILHVRDTDLPSSFKPQNAYWETLNLLKQLPRNTQFILHCVSGPAEYIETAISLGGYISVAGNVTYPNADHIRKLVSLAPTARILLETDAPYLAPQQFRGQSCQPNMITKTAEFVKNELSLDLDQIFENSLQVFNIQ